MRTFLRSPIGISLLLSLALWPAWPLGFAEAVSQIYWNTAFSFVSHHAPSSIVVVSTDGVGDVDTAEEAEVLERIRRQMPRRVFLDVRIPYGLDAAGDARLKSVVNSFGGDISFVVRSNDVNRHDETTLKFPSKEIVGNHAVYISSWNDNFIHAVVSAPYYVKLYGREYYSLSLALAGVEPKQGDLFYPDFSMDPKTITRLSVRSILDGREGPGILSGRTVIVTSSAGVGALRYWGHGVVMPVAHDIAGAEALRRPFSYDVTAVPLLIFAVLMSYFVGNIENRKFRISVYILSVFLVFYIPVSVRYFAGISFPPELAIIYLSIYGAIRAWRRRTNNIQQTSISGLPNFVALTSSHVESEKDVIVAVVGRYEEMLATLPRELHGECATQIARRLSVGSGAAQIYHGDGGHFAWCEEARPLDVQLSHLEGLRALFSAPLQVGTHTFDTNIHFGLDRNEGIDLLTRVNSALASANDALSSGRAVEVFEAHRLAEAPWELSLHARIDEGLRNGDIWLAFQPQWDFHSQRIAGAEALIRWNHPTRGFIPPDQFILQAERAGRIDALTYWVLEEAITAAQAINALGRRFQMSINLSAQMVGKPDLVGNFREIVSRRGIDPRLLTIEITETSSLIDRAEAVHNLSLLRDLGFRLSIDDFGTGEASLTYLADLPSDELKIDRRFVSRLLTSERDRVIVGSTISLAHALGQQVVAEGIEDLATFQLLAELGCDQAQGYYLSKPQPFDVMFRDYQERLELRNQAI